MWEWLGEPLAVDFANTTKRVGTEDRECLRSGADLAEWARLERVAVPPVSARAADARLGEVRELRAAVVAVLHAARARAAAPSPAVVRVNAAARRVPFVTLLADDGGIASVPAFEADPLDELLARVAHATIELAAAGDTWLGFCDAPSCGQFFAGGRTGRRWCSDACGTRARVARHARRHRHA